MKQLLIATIALLLITGCKKAKEVKYEVTCASCSLTYSNSSNNTEQRDITNNWEYVFDPESDHFLYISAQNKKETGSVTVKILQGGKEIEDASCSSAFCIATADRLLD